MTMFKHALVVVGREAGSERCFPWLRRLMDGATPRIRLLTVLDPVSAPVVVKNKVVAYYVDQQEDARRLEVCAGLRTSTNRLQELGFEVSVDVRFGDPVGSILDLAEAHHIDVIALAISAGGADTALVATHGRRAALGGGEGSDLRRAPGRPARGVKEI
jgi:hypothetical protein